MDLVSKFIRYNPVKKLKQSFKIYKCLFKLFAILIPNINIFMSVSYFFDVAVLRPYIDKNKFLPFHYIFYGFCRLFCRYIFLHAHMP